jgi:hypothetical protein
MTGLLSVGFPMQNQRIHKSKTSGTVQHDTQFNAEHNTKQINPRSWTAKATDTLRASTNTVSFCTVLTITPPAQVTTLCSSKLPQSLSIRAYKCVQSLAKWEPRVVSELMRFGIIATLNNRYEKKNLQMYDRKPLQSVWEEHPPKLLKYKSLYFPACGPKLTDVTLYKNRSENKVTTPIFQVIYFHLELGQFEFNSATTPLFFHTVLATNEGIPHIVGQTFLFPVDWSQCPVISLCVTTTSLLGHLSVRGRHDFVSALERDDKHSATKPPCKITM